MAVAKKDDAEEKSHDWERNPKLDRSERFTIATASPAAKIELPGMKRHAFLHHHVCRVRASLHRQVCKRVDLQSAIGLSHRLNLRFHMGQRGFERRAPGGARRALGKDVFSL